MFTGVGAFTLSYDYNLAGELKKITDATNMTINYGYDSIGRVSSVTGADSLYAGVSNYASNLQYRAWGGLKSMTDGKGYVSSLSYNTKLQPSQFCRKNNWNNRVRLAIFAILTRLAMHTLSQPEAPTCL